MGRDLAVWPVVAVSTHLCYLGLRLSRSVKVIQVRQWGTTIGILCLLNGDAVGTTIGISNLLNGDSVGTIIRIYYGDT